MKRIRVEIARIAKFVLLYCFFNFRPSTTHEEELPNRISEAERHGNKMNECNRIYPNCMIDLMDMFTLIEDSLESS